VEFCNRDETETCAWFVVDLVKDFFLPPLVVVVAILLLAARVVPLFFAMAVE
jgi:hypothetical protein